MLFYIYCILYFFKPFSYFVIVFSVSFSCILSLAIRFHHGLINLINKSLSLSLSLSLFLQIHRNFLFLMFVEEILSLFFLLFTSMYRRLREANFIEYVNTLTKYFHNYKNIIIISDLNCNLFTTLYEPNHLRDFTSHLSLNILPSEPTFNTSYSDSWLDVCIVDSMRKVFSFKKFI